MLSFNESNGSFILTTTDKEKAEAVGLTLSTRIRGPNGEHVFYTSDQDKKPYFNPYAAIPFWREADPKAMAKLKDLLEDYDASWADNADLVIPAPKGKDYLPYQKAGIAYALRRGNCLIGDEPGLGKAQPLWAKVLTPDGWRAIGDLKKDDPIYTPDGGMARVTAVYDRDIMDVYRLEFNDGSAAYASEDHLWKIRTRDSNDWFIAPTWELKNRLSRGLRVEIPLTEPTLGRGTLPVDPYLVGLLLGDGGLSQHTALLTTADAEIVDYCKNIALEYNTTLNCADFRYTYRFSSGQAGRTNKLRAALADLGMTGKIAREKSVPVQYLFGSRETRLAVLRGLMDSDGWVCESGTGFASTSERLVDDVRQLVQSLGGTARKSRKTNSWSLSINIPECPFILSRKASIWQPNLKYKPRRLLRSVTLHSSEPVRCIAVSSRDRLYITDDYIVTHNTIQAIGIANAVVAKRVLILCPASIRLNWRREIQAWSVLPNASTEVVLKSGRGVNSFSNYVVCSYDLARNEGIFKALWDREWDLIVLDEAHYLKSIDAIRTRAVFGGGMPGSIFHDQNLSERAERTVALTGTPLPNRPRECYTMARGLNWEAIDWMSYERFLYRYNPSMKMDTGAMFEEKGRLPELQARLRCNIMVRRLKKDVLPQLPDKRYEMSYVEPNGAINDVLAREKLIDFDPNVLFNPNFDLDGTPISTIRREMGEAKVPRVIEHLKFLLDIVEIPKVVVFAHHNSVINALKESLAGYGVVGIRGGMSSAAKDASVQQFAYGLPRVFIGQLDTMEGIDGLQHVCDHVVFAEPAWNPGRNEQCVDRCHRIGQHSNVVAQFLIVEDSMDEKVLHAVLGKAQSIYASLDEKIR